MIINPTKKAQPLFNKMSKVKEANYGKAYAQKNPFFSWHSNYYTVNRKKILILVNDLTLTPVVLADINATNKQHLGAYIEEGIRAAFRLSDVSDAQIDTYFELAGEFLINAGHNRRVTGITNEYLLYASAIPINLTTNLQHYLTAELADMVFNGLESYTSINEVSATFKRGLKLFEVTEQDLVRGDKATYDVSKTWEPFATWQPYANQGWGEDYDEVAEAVKDNNQQLLQSFERYLKEGEQLSDKVSRKHVENVAFYLNAYLLYGNIHTPVTDILEVQTFLEDWYIRKDPWASVASVKKMGTSLKKFYGFLERAKEISQTELKDVKEAIGHGVEMGVFYLMEQNNPDYF